jgi:hypothetical protein
MNYKSVTKNNILTPAQLERDATMPQCLDNQYVSDNTLKYMLKKTLDYEAPSVKELRKAEVHNEFIRSLVYSSQVVINRAFFKNNEFLYSNYTIDNPERLSDFAELVRIGAIVPYLYEEESLGDKFDFDVSKSGDRATKALLEHTGYDIPCVRLAVDNEANKQKTARLESRFGEYLTGLKSKSELLINVMASELFDRPLEEQEWRSFLSHVDSLSVYAGRIGRGLKRNLVYKDWFIEDEVEKTDVSKGRFRKPPQDLPFLYQLKKIVDLRYNTNLPDMLGRYTFTPVGLPSRVALQDFIDTSVSSLQLEQFVDQQLANIRRVFMAHSQKAMSLPLLKELSVSDVLEIRRDIAEWESFKQSQQKILSDDPLNVLNNIDEFQASFDAFQQALSSWYNNKYQRKVTKGRYASFVTVAIQIAGQMIVAGLDFTDNKVTQILAIAGARMIPATVKGYAVKLLVNVIDIGQMKLDADRSYSLELMQSNQELTRADVVQLINSVKSVQADKVASSGPLADQGKE